MTSSPARADLEAGTISRTVTVNASIETCWAVLTDPDHIARWWGHPSRFPDGWHAGSVGTFFYQDMSFPVRIDVLERPHRFALTWASGRDLSDGPTTVEFTLAEDGPTTTVSVLESGFAELPNREDRMRENEDGWNAVLDSYVSYVESGDPQE